MDDYKYILIHYSFGDSIYIIGHYNFTLISILERSNDQAAFHIFIDRLTSESPTETFDIPKSIAEVE
ncbi:hypothetical protein CYANOKiyG1_00510 [Okeania sp. KiyG1]|nr:hypothetical protein CYANOKiyG1_00510 [Okeania sp. KiyG1]